jgi:PAS domain S-box-containing protein
MVVCDTGVLMARRSQASDSRHRLVTLLRTEGNNLLGRWVERVRGDSELPSANKLSATELRDELLRILSAIAEDLERLPEDEVARRPSAVGVVKNHARDRASKGYSVGEELRELALLRAVVYELCGEHRLRLRHDDARVFDAAIDTRMVAGADEMARVVWDRRQELLMLLDASHEAVFAWELDGRIVFWNRGAEELYGWTRDEAVGTHSHTLLATEHPLGMPRLEEIVAAEGRWEGQLSHATRDGPRVLVESRWVVEQVGVGQAIVLEANRDVTDRRRLENEREALLASERAARAEAERAAHLRDEFVALVSHELRTPLNAILGWATMLQAGKLDAAATAKALEVVVRNAKAQAELVEDLLDISRIGSGKLRLDVRPVNLAAIMENVVASHVPAARARGVRLELHAEEGDFTVQGDPGRLEQIVANVLSNAIKFTPKGGSVEAIGRRAGSRVEVVVRDTGQGIAPEFLPHIFERFRQAEASLTRQHRGLGLGLALVKFLVEQHGGAVRAESEGEGHGSTFTLSLPLATFKQPAGAAPSPIDACASLAGVKTLVLDDEEDARALLHRILVDCHAEVTIAGSAREALDLLPRVHPDVMICDIGMPETDGYHFITAVRALPPEQGGRTPAVALTALARPEDRLRALRAGYQMHLAKPVDQSELLVALANLAGRLGAPETRALRSASPSTATAPRSGGPSGLPPGAAPPRSRRAR